MLSSTPYFSMAAKVSPPPASEKALLRAMAVASVRVPTPNCANSNTPTGPFQRSGPADATNAAMASAESGPMSRIMSSADTWRTSLTSASAFAENSFPPTTSVGMGMTMPRFLDCSSSRLQMSSMLGSYSDLPTLKPKAARQVLVMPPPTMSWSTLLNKDARTVSLVETLEPATMANSGRAGFSSAVSSADNSLTSKGPAHTMGAYFATPCVLASARCAVPNAS